MTTELHEEAFIHWDVSAEIADKVRRYVERGESVSDLALIELIQKELKREFPITKSNPNPIRT